jgi:hypothetical protein
MNRTLPVIRILLFILIAMQLASHHSAARNTLDGGLIVQLS